MSTTTTTTATTTTDYTLTPVDLDIFTSIIDIQNTIGMATPALTDAGVAHLGSWVNSMTSNQWNTPVYNSISNSLLKSWVDSMFSGFATLPTEYQSFDNTTAFFPELFLANSYRTYIDQSDCQDCLQSGSYFQAFSVGASSIPSKYEDGACSSPTMGPWARPTAPSAWAAGVNQAFTKWGTKGIPPTLANIGNLYSASAFSTNWSPKISSQAFARLQELAMGNLTLIKDLSDAECIFIMYLMCALPTYNTGMQLDVKMMVQQKVTSYELGEDNFINHLIYYVLMCWVDPLGNYTFTGDQIKNKLNGLNNVLLSTDVATQTIKTGVQKYLKILTAVPTYPMTDPYDTQDGFITRQSDVLGALTTGWAEWS